MHARAGQQVEGLLSELVQRLDRATGVHFPPQRVETAEKSPAIVQALFQSFFEEHVSYREIRGTGIVSHGEVVVLHSKVRRPLRVGVHLGPAPVRHRDAIRQSDVDFFAHLVDDRDHRGGIVPGPGRRIGNATRHEPLASAAVIVEGMGDAANQGVLVGALGVHGEQFANVDTGYVGANGTEEAPIIRRGIRLHVIGLHVGRSPCEPDENNRGVGRDFRFPCLGTKPQKVAER